MGHRAVRAPDAFILAGGQSARMGTDKSAVELDGRAFLDRVVAAVGPVARSISIVGGGPRLTELTALPDRRPGLGPLAGIETALAACSTDRAVIVACDLPFVTAALLEFLIAREDAGPDGAVVPLDSDGRVSPLCAVYPRSALPLVGELLDSGERTPRALLVRIRTDLVPFADYAHLENAGQLLRNVNTPEDLAEARRIAEDSRRR